MPTSPPLHPTPATASSPSGAVLWATAADARLFPALAAVLAAVGVVAAVAGAVQDHTGIPFWDMWDGYVGFFRRWSEGDSAVWWSWHNEHRIVLARVVFWIDLAFFGGHGVVLVVANLVLATIIAVLFAALFLERTADVPRRSDRVAFALILVAILFAGAQWENFRWGLQSCFFLAQLLPLAAFLALQRSADRIPGTRQFVTACTFGVLAAGTMANGVLALPLMALTAPVTGMRAMRTAVLGALSALVVIAYLYGYQTAEERGLPTFELLHRLPGVIAFALAYLGSPFPWLVGVRFDAVQVALLGGIAFVALSAVALLRAARVPRDRLAVPLGTFIVFVLATAVVTAEGRSILGLNLAVASRYSTPVLMAWSALFVLYAPTLLEIRLRRRALTTCLLVLFVGVLGARHVKDLPYFLASPSAQRLAALTLVLDIHDDQALSASAPRPDVARRESRWLESRRLAYFGDPTFDDLRTRIGTVALARSGPRCPGRVDSLATIPGESRYLRVAGEFVQERPWRSSPFFFLIDRDRQVVGIALWTANPPLWEFGSRGPMDDAAAKPAGAFKGYVLADSDLSTLAMYGIDKRCETQPLDVPQRPR